MALSSQKRGRVSDRETAETDKNQEAAASTNVHALLDQEEALQDRINQHVHAIHKTGYSNYLAQILEQKSQALLPLKILAARGSKACSLAAMERANENNDEESHSKLKHKVEHGLNMINWGRLFFAQGHFENAIKSFQFAQQAFSATHKFQKEASAHFNLISASIQQANALLNQPHLDQTEKALDLAQQTLRQVLPRFQNTIEDLENLADIHNILSLASHRLESYEDALRYCQVEYALLLRVSALKHRLDPQINKAKENLIVILTDLVKQQLAHQQLETASKTCQSLFHIFRLLTPFRISDHNQRKFAEQAKACGQQFLEKNQPEKAIDSFLLEIQLLRQINKPLHSDSSRNTEARDNLAIASINLNLSRLQAHARNKDAAHFAETLSFGITLLHHIKQHSHSNSHLLQNLDNHFLRFAKIMKKTGDQAIQQPQIKSRAYKIALELLSQLTPHSLAPETKRDLQMMELYLNGSTRLPKRRGAISAPCRFLYQPQLKSALEQEASRTASLPFGKRY